MNSKQEKKEKRNEKDVLACAIRPGGLVLNPKE
jgi:hypothetical protein